MPRPKRLSDASVLEAAMRVMTRAGPESFTLADVAAVSGVAPATLVQRFGGKHGLIVAAVANDNAAFERMLETLPQGAGAAAVIAVFRLITPDSAEVEAFADQLLWLRMDMRDPELNALARARFQMLRSAVAERLPPMAMAPDDAARLVEAQWQGALNQWGIAREGSPGDYVTAALASWFALVRR